MLFRCVCYAEVQMLGPGSSDAHAQHYIYLQLTHEVIAHEYMSPTGQYLSAWVHYSGACVYRGDPTGIATDGRGRRGVGGGEGGSGNGHCGGLLSRVGRDDDAAADDDGGA